MRYLVGVLCSLALAMPVSGCETGNGGTGGNGGIAGSGGAAGSGGIAGGGGIGGAGGVAGSAGTGGTAGGGGAGGVAGSAGTGGSGGSAGSGGTVTDACTGGECTAGSDAKANCETALDLCINPPGAGGAGGAGGNGISFTPEECKNIVEGVFCAGGDLGCNVLGCAVDEALKAQCEEAVQWCLYYCAIDPECQEDQCLALVVLICKVAG